jgi:hypothetical protein
MILKKKNQADHCSRNVKTNDNPEKGNKQHYQIVNTS